MTDGKGYMDMFSLHMSSDSEEEAVVARGESNEYKQCRNHPLRLTVPKTTSYRTREARKLLEGEKRSIMRGKPKEDSRKKPVMKACGAPGSVRAKWSSRDEIELFSIILSTLMSGLYPVDCSANIMRFRTYELFWSDVCRSVREKINKHWLSDQQIFSKVHALKYKFDRRHTGNSTDAHTEQLYSIMQQVFSFPNGSIDNVASQPTSTGISKQAERRGEILQAISRKAGPLEMNFLQSERVDNEVNTERDVAVTPMKKSLLSHAEIASTVLEGIRSGLGEIKDTVDVMRLTAKINTFCQKIAENLQKVDKSQLKEHVIKEFSTMRNNYFPYARQEDLLDLLDDEQLFRLLHQLCGVHDSPNVPVDGTAYVPSPEQILSPGVIEKNYEFCPKSPGTVPASTSRKHNEELQPHNDKKQVMPAPLSYEVGEQCKGNSDCNLFSFCDNELEKPSGSNLTQKDLDIKRHGNLSSAGSKKCSMPKRGCVASAAEKSMCMPESIEQMKSKETSEIFSGGRRKSKRKRNEETAKNNQGEADLPVQEKKPVNESASEIFCFPAEDELSSRKRRVRGIVSHEEIILDKHGDNKEVTEGINNSRQNVSFEMSQQFGGMQNCITTNKRRVASAVRKAISMLEPTEQNQSNDTADNIACVSENPEQRMSDDSNDDDSNEVGLTDKKKSAEALGSVGINFPVHDELLTKKSRKRNHVKWTKEDEIAIAFSVLDAKNRGLITHSLTSDNLWRKNFVLWEKVREQINHGLRGKYSSNQISEKFIKMKANFIKNKYSVKEQNKTFYAVLKKILTKDRKATTENIRERASTYVESDGRRHTASPHSVRGNCSGMLDGEQQPGKDLSSELHKGEHMQREHRDATGNIEKGRDDCQKSQVATPSDLFVQIDGHPSSHNSDGSAADETRKGNFKNTTDEDSIMYQHIWQECEKRLQDMESRVMDFLNKKFSDLKNNPQEREPSSISLGGFFGTELAHGNEEGSHLLAELEKHLKFKSRKLEITMELCKIEQEEITRQNLLRDFIKQRCST